MIEDIQRFLCVVDNRSITKAAKILHLTQPALSLTLQRLEKEIGAKLISRSGKQLTITSDGEAFYRIGQRIVELWERAKDAKLRKQQGKKFTIGLYDNAALKLATYFQKQLLRKDCLFEIKIDISSHLLQDISYGIIDICICVIDKKSPLLKNLTIIKELSEELIPVSQKNFGQDIPKIPFIVYNKGSFTRKQIDETFFQNAINPTIITESTSTSFMKALALAGSGVALLPKNVIATELASKKLRVQKLPFKFYRNIGILLRKDSTLQKSDEFIKKIVESLE